MDSKVKMSRNFSFNDAIGLVLDDEDDDDVVLAMAAAGIIGDANNNHVEAGKHSEYRRYAVPHTRHARTDCKNDENSIW
jgi:hypothetical protein